MQLANRVSDAYTINMGKAVAPIASHSSIISTSQLPLLGDGSMGSPQSVRSQLASFHLVWCIAAHTYTEPIWDNPAPYNPSGLTIPHPLGRLTSPHPHLYLRGANKSSLQPPRSLYPDEIEMINTHCLYRGIILGPHTSQCLWKSIWRDQVEKAHHPGLCVIIPSSYFLFLALDRAARESVDILLLVTLSRINPAILELLDNPPLSLLGRCNSCVLLRTHTASLSPKNAPPRSVVQDSKGYYHRLTAVRYIQLLQQRTLSEIQFLGLALPSEPVCITCATHPMHKLNLLLQQSVQGDARSQSFNIRPLTNLLWAQKDALLTENQLLLAQKGTNLTCYLQRYPAAVARNYPSVDELIKPTRNKLNDFISRGYITSFLHQSKWEDFGFTVVHNSPQSIIPKSTFGKYRLIVDNSHMHTTTRDERGVLSACAPRRSINMSEAKMCTPLDGAYRLVAAALNMVILRPNETLVLLGTDVEKAFRMIGIRPMDWHMCGILMRKWDNCPGPWLSISTRCDMGSRTSVSRWSLLSTAIKHAINLKHKNAFLCYVDDYYCLATASDGNSILRTLKLELENLGLSTDKDICSTSAVQIGIEVALAESATGKVVMRAKPDKYDVLVTELKSYLVRQVSKSHADTHQLYMTLQWHATMWPHLLWVITPFKWLMRVTLKEAKRRSPASTKLESLSQIRINLSSHIYKDIRTRLRASASWIISIVRPSFKFSAPDLLSLHSLPFQLPIWKGCNLTTMVLPQEVFYTVSDSGKGKTGTPHLQGGWCCLIVNHHTCSTTQKDKRTGKWAACPYTQHEPFLASSSTDSVSPAGMEWYGFYMTVSLLTYLGHSDFILHHSIDNLNVPQTAFDFCKASSISSVLRHLTMMICARHNIILQTIRHLPRSDPLIVACDRGAAGIPSPLLKPHLQVPLNSMSHFEHFCKVIKQRQ